MNRALWMLATIVLAACAAGPDRPGDLRGDSGADDATIVASDLDNAPFAYVDERGEPAGRDVEMMKALAARAGLALTWQRMPFDALLPALESGRVDVVCATLGVTPERARRMRFTRPYFRTSIAVVVRAGPGEPRGLDDLAGLRIHAGLGTTSERAVQGALGEAALAPAPKSDGASTGQRLLDGEIDAAVMDGPAADALVAGSGGRLVRLDETLGAEHYALALPLDRRVLTRKLDAALVDLELEGVLAELDREHGLSPESTP